MQGAEGVPSMTSFSGQRSRIELGVFATGSASPELQEEPSPGLSAFFSRELEFFICAQMAGGKYQFRRDLVLNRLYGIVYARRLSWANKVPGLPVSY